MTQECPLRSTTAEVVVCPMSVIPPVATELRTLRNGSFVPQADVQTRSTHGPLQFDAERIYVSTI
jgi:hypothetical protein